MVGLRSPGLSVSGPLDRRFRVRVLDDRHWRGAVRLVRVRTCKACPCKNGVGRWGGFKGVISAVDRSIWADTSLY